VLTIFVQTSEEWDAENEKFILSGTTLELEHSLVSVSKWESEFEKPFLSNDEKTSEEALGYIKCMILTPDFPPEIFRDFTEDHYNQINAYINKKMTATWFSEHAKHTSSREIITAEIIYYWMTALNINIECQYWHLTRLLTLIRVCNEKNTPPKKMGRSTAMQRQRDLNAARKAQLGTRG
jgi:hypothetical protein